jgi:hypothetical protein
MPFAPEDYDDFEDADDIDESTTVFASFDTVCVDCQDWIREGDEIQKIEGEWVHADC